MIPNPKQRFMQSKVAVEAMSSIANNSEFIKAADAALLELVYSATVTNDPAAAIAGFHRITGAVEVLKKLSTIHLQPDIPKQRPPAQLNHQA